MSAGIKGGAMAPEERPPEGGSSEGCPAAVVPEVYKVIVFMLSSAKLLGKEPKEYGPFRLIDAAGRLAAVMVKCGLADEAVQALGDEIEKEKDHGLDTEEDIARFLDRVLALATQHLVNAGGRAGE